jgi:hypothetical protein
VRRDTSAGLGLKEVAGILARSRNRVQIIAIGRIAIRDGTLKVINVRCARGVQESGLLVNGPVQGLAPRALSTCLMTNSRYEAVSFLHA